MGKNKFHGFDEIVNVYLDDVQDLEKSVVAKFVVEFNSGLVVDDIEFTYDDDHWGIDMHSFSKEVMRFITKHFDDFAEIPSRDILELEFQ